MSYPGRPPIMQGLPMAYMPMTGPAPPLMPAVMPLQHVSSEILNQCSEDDLFNFTDGSRPGDYSHPDSGFPKIEP